MADLEFRVKFLTGLKANIDKAIQSGIIDEGDFIITSDTSELVFINKSKQKVFIKAEAPSSVFASKEAAEQYIAAEPGIEGKIIKVLEDGKYNTYIVQPDKTLEEVGGVTKEVEDAIKTAVQDKAPINNPVFTGTVTLPQDPATDMQAATKQYVDRLIEGLVSSAPGVVGKDNALPINGYYAGQTWRVVDSGTYAGAACEVGDLIICVNDYVEGSASDNDFIVVQANIDGAVTNSTGTSTVDNFVAFDSLDGKKIKDSGIAKADVQDAIDKKHEHTNKDILDTYDKSQTDLLSAAQSTAKTYVDGRIGDLAENTTVKEYIDTAIGSGGVDTAEAIAQAKQEAINTSKEYVNTSLTILEF